ncbi:hypothetical protein MMPV_004299 [Pyropia vietnamensis]
MAPAGGGGGRGKGLKRSHDAALAASNASVIAEKAAIQANRMKYLLSQSKLFSHFLGDARSSPAPATGARAAFKKGAAAAAAKDAPDSVTRRRRLTEKEEDAQLLRTEEAELPPTTRLAVQPSNIKGQMRPYQLEGLNFLISLFERGVNGILADEMGLGKTLQTISLLGFLRQYKNITGPHLVIVPKSTLGNWMNEFDRWCPDIRPVRFHGDQEARRYQMREELVFGRFDVCITSYEMVSKEKSFLSKFAWRYLVIDEAHRIKNEGSLLSQVVRLFETQARLLVTGTPLQNNLKELWALLNFLLPDVFSSSEDFESWFSLVEETDGGPAGAIAAAPAGDGGGGDGDAATGAAEAAEKAKAKTEIVSQLHAVLRPFLIRRHKAEVETSLPPKTETVLFTWLTPMQLDLYRNLLRKDVTAINGKGGDRVRLLNLVMQLRKVCQHPYLFEGQEDRSLDPYGDHLITNCAKLKLLDKLLPRLRAGGHRVLIFSQMTRVLDILEDYCHENLRNYPYCRIDGGTDGESRDAEITDFNRPGSEKFIFLLSTRAGGLGINLATADTVIIFDSDWNPQMDLQAMDRAHRIGQKKPVTVLRLVTRDSVEERILRKAMEKLRLDSLVIQQGRLATTKNVNKEELLDMVRCGADKFFSAKAGEFEDEDLDAILARGQRKTKELNDDLSARAAAAAKTGNLSLLDLTLDGRTAQGGSVYNFQGENYAPGAVAGGGSGAAGDNFFLDVGKRSRVRTYDENALAGVGVNGGMSAAEVAASRARAKFKTLKYKAPKLDDHQLFNTARLKELFAAERAIVDAYNERVEAAANEAADAATAAVSAGLDPPPLPTPPAPPSEPLLSPAEEAEKQQLVRSGFANWTRREFNGFVRGCERHGRTAIAAIVAEVGGTKTAADVQLYATEFWRRGPTTLDSWPRLAKSIEEGEAKLERRRLLDLALTNKVAAYEDPWSDLELTTGGGGGGGGGGGSHHAGAGTGPKGWVPEEDRWLVCMTAKLGYGAWEEVRREARRDAQFRFDWFLKSRTALEIKRRVDYLIRIIQREADEAAAAAAAVAAFTAANAMAAANRRKSDGGGGAARKAGMSGGKAGGPGAKAGGPAVTKAISPYVKGGGPSGKSVGPVGKAGGPNSKAGVPSGARAHSGPYVRPSGGVAKTGIPPAGVPRRASVASPSSDPGASVAPPAGEGPPRKLSAASAAIAAAAASLPRKGSPPAASAGGGAAGRKGVSPPTAAATGRGAGQKGASPAAGDARKGVSPPAAAAPAGRSSKSPRLAGAADRSTGGSTGSGSKRKADQSSMDDFFGRPPTGPPGKKRAP